MAIVVIGSVFVDIKGYPYDELIPTGRNSGYIEEKHGGVSRNMAEDIANVELRPMFISTVDKSGAGLSVVEKLRRHKCNVDYVPAIEDGMGTWLAVFDNNGDVCASISKRPDLSYFNTILAEHGDEIFSQADSVVLEFDLERETLRRVMKLAEKYNVPVYSAVSNMTIAVQRRDYLTRLDCFVCNLQEAGILFFEDYEGITPEEMQERLAAHIKAANIKRMVVTMGGDGAVYADSVTGESGYCPAIPVTVVDTTGAGDAFAAGITIGLTYGKTLGEACVIGSRLAAAVICSVENVCPRFQPNEFGIEVEAK